MDLKTTLRTPGWRRAQILRRWSASVLLLCSAALLISSLRDTDPEVLVLARDVPAGAALTEEDLRLTPVPADLIPDTALNRSEEIVGRVAASALSAGEIATGPRLVGDELLASSVMNITDIDPGEEINMVPLTLADPSVIPLLLHGDTISVLTHNPETGHPDTIAAGGRVILAGEATPSTILIALPRAAAEQVAAASISSPLAVVLTGPRSTPGGTAGNTSLSEN